MGVSTLTERLMEAIAVITSKARWVDDEPDEDGQPTQVEVLAWNPTVANLTLMAIGSSAPEILLSTVELTAGSGFSGELGPMTIVGSAAFNLLLVSAIAVSAVPDGETRAIKNYSVFIVTAVRSAVAHGFAECACVVARATELTALLRVIADDEHPGLRVADRHPRGLDTGRRDHVGGDHDAPPAAFHGVRGVLRRQG
jgi:hypothetical protein